MMFLRCLCLVFVSAFAVADSKSNATAASASFAVQNVRVFDGEKIISANTVVVRAGKITEIGSKLSTAGLRLIDGAGKTLVPGFIDAHTHNWGDAGKDALRFGVTTELEMMGDGRRMKTLQLKRDSLSQTDEADLYSAGYAVTAPGGHGTQYGNNPPTLAANADAKAFAQARFAEGSDYLKLIVEDFSAYGTSKRLPTLSQGQVLASVNAAKLNKKLAVVHVSTLASAQTVVDAGAHGMVHIFADVSADPNFVRSMTKQRAFMIPTLSVIAAVAGSGEGAKLSVDPRLQEYLSSTQKQSLSSSFGRSDSAQLTRAMASVRALKVAGVDILAGTDAGNPGTAHGASIHHEMKLLVQAGLTPIEALRAATSLPAKRFALAQRGKIAPGYRADLVLVEGDPTIDIEKTRAIAQVWKNGYALTRAPFPKVSAAPPAAVGKQGLISDFESGEAVVNFGSGWFPTTDQMAGGASIVALKNSKTGALNSKSALIVTGEIKPGFAFPWSGAIWFPQKTPMSPANYSKYSELVFHVKGDSASYSVMLFSGSEAQSIPQTQSFKTSATWQEVKLSLAEFAGADLTQLRGIAFTAGDGPRTFQFEIDQIEIR
jgi:imidazolonepropionase-like amidohydrolase